jgi:hypothetical protein
VDLDNDGIREVIAPITAFYDLQDKLYIAAIPLASIIFKYDPAKQQYLPANALFKTDDLKNLVDVPDLKQDASNHFEHCGAVLENLSPTSMRGKKSMAGSTIEKTTSLMTSVRSSSESKRS